MTAVGDPDQPQPPRERWLHAVPNTPHRLDPGTHPEPHPDGPSAPPAGGRPASAGGHPPAPRADDRPASDAGHTPAPDAGDRSAVDGGHGPARDAGDRPARDGRPPGAWAGPVARQTWGAATATAPALPRPRPEPDPHPPEPDRLVETAHPSGSTPSFEPADPCEPGPSVESARPTPAERPRPARGAASAEADGRAGVAHLVRAVGMLVVVVVVGTSGAWVADRWVGAAGDGHPALYVLVALALPFWDALPARLGPRLAVVAGVTAAVAAVWFGLGMLADPTWWRSHVSFGLACLTVGTAHLVLAALLRRRTVAV